MYTSIISPAALRQLIASEHPPLLFACHHDLKDPEAGRRLWQEKRIANAGFLHLDDDLSGPIVPGKTGRHPLPDKSVFWDKVQRLGYRETDQQIVVYDAKGGGIAARAWWMFKWVGHSRVAVLDGGLPAYERLSDERVTADPEFTLATLLAKKEKSTPTSVNLGEVEKIISDQSQLLIDSRTAPRFRGEEEPIDPVAGHIPGAINLPWPENLDENGRFKSRDTLKKRFAPLRDEASDNIFYCGSGVTACHNILAYYHAFGEMPGLYPGSWSEYLLKNC